jgi:uncharacterized protein
MISPVPPQARINAVDVLRAVALFGIAINHSEFEFLAGPPPYPEFGQVLPTDAWVSQVVGWFTSGKFFTIFSFLFGLSFAIQLENAARRGADFAGRFAWRLTVLLAIGFVHSIVFTGDILVIYALLGYLLIPLRTVPTRTLMIVAVVLLLNLPGVVLGFLQINRPPPTPEEQQAAAQAGREFAAFARHMFEVKSSGSLADLAALDLGQATMMRVWYQIGTGRLWIMFGCFLLGVCAGRAGIFRDSEAHRGFMTKLLIAGGIVGAISTAGLVARPPAMVLASPSDVLAAFNASLQQAALAAFYASLVTLSYWRRPAGWLATLAPVGRMGLTTYLMQTVFGVTLFYGIGFGMLGRLGSTLGVLSGIAFFIVQYCFARAWLARFSTGPVEWAWRALTYFRVRPRGVPA